MSTEQQRKLKRDLTTVRDYVKLHQPRALLAAALTNMNDFQGTMMTSIFQNGGLTGHVSIVSSTTPENPPSFIVLLNAEEKVVLSANIQIFIYHMYRLEKSIRGKGDEQEQMSAAWKDYYFKLVEEITAVESLEDVDTDEPFGMTLSIAQQVLGNHILAMK
jgi:hypothetical protein